MTSSDSRPADIRKQPGNAGASCLHAPLAHWSSPKFQPRSEFVNEAKDCHDHYATKAQRELFVRPRTKGSLFYFILSQQIFITPFPNFAISSHHEVDCSEQCPMKLSEGKENTCAIDMGCIAKMLLEVHCQLCALDYVENFFLHAIQLHLSVVMLLLSQP